MSGSSGAAEATRCAAGAEPLPVEMEPYALLDRAYAGDAVAMVHGDEAGEIPLRDAWVGGEVAQVAGALRQARVEADQRLGVVRSDRPQVDGAPVGGHDVGLPVGRRGRGLTLCARATSPG